VAVEWSHRHRRRLHGYGASHLAPELLTVQSSDCEKIDSRAHDKPGCGRWSAWDAERNFKVFPFNLNGDLKRLLPRFSQFSFMNRRYFTLLFVIGSTLVHHGYSAPYTVSTLAGYAAYGSNDGTGAASRFYNPQGLAVDHSGNLYVADTDNSTIRKITAAGVVTTIAGTAGMAGSSDGVGSAARFWKPEGAAVDAAGNVYVSDTANQTIKKISSDGTVVTLAGNVLLEPGWADGVGTAARFSNPEGLAADDAGNVYVADYGNDAIRKIAPDGQVTTIAGIPGSGGNEDGPAGTARFQYPYAVAVDGSGSNIYVADYGNDAIRKINGGIVTTVVANLSRPRGVTLDSVGNIYVADTENDVIRKVTSAGVVTIFAGGLRSTGSINGVGTAARFNQPYSVAANADGDVYVTSFNDHAIRKIAAAGLVTTFAGELAFGTDDGLGGAARFSSPSGIAVDASGTAYIADTANHVIRKITASGVVSTFAGTPLTPGQIDGTGSAARFNLPTGVALDRAGNIYVADAGNFAIRKITVGGVVSTVAASLLGGPTGVAVDMVGNIYVAEYGGRTIDKITTSGVVSTFAGTPDVAGSADGPASSAQFFAPTGVAVDGSGNVYVADYLNCTIRKISTAGVVSTLAGAANTGGNTDGFGSAARFNLPRGVAVDGAGNVYVADSHGHTIRKITPLGLVSTIAGAAYIPGAGDGIGGAARFNLPQGIAVDGSGNVYVADTANNAIRKLSRPSALTVITQPQGLVVDTGGTVTFTVEVEGPVAPNYQWLHDGRNIADATGSSYQISNAAANQAGTYTVVAYNEDGLTTSSPAMLNLSASVILGALAATYDGSPHLATATTSPAGLRVTFTYDGSVNAPINAGNYTVVGTVEDATYVGSSTNSLQIAPSAPPIMWPAPVALVHGTILSDIQLNATAGIPGVFNYNPAPGAILAEGVQSLSVTFTPTDLNYRPVSSSRSIIVIPNVSTSGQALNDSDGDGKADLLWSNVETGERSTWFLNGGTIKGGTSLGVVPMVWVISATGDFDGDGKADIFWTNTATGDRTIWLMNGGAMRTNTFMGTIPVEWVISATGDFNGDGKKDLVWTNTSTGDRAVWLLNGTSVSGGGYLGTVPVEWMIKGTGDFNGDGNADLVWSNVVTGERSLWYQNGTTTIGGDILKTTPVAWAITGVGDFNGDGKADIFLTNMASGDRVIWLMNGSTITTNAFIGTVPVEWTVSGTGDFNGDGKKDIFWTNTATGDRAMWLLNGSTVTGGGFMGTIPVEWKINN
jgi:DNA-binding beta-propeller fold protein YncE